MRCGFFFGGPFITSKSSIIINYKTNSSMKNNVLIIGGTGKTGRKVADRLIKKNMPVRIGSRSSNPPFDWQDASTWPKALE